MDLCWDVTCVPRVPLGMTGFQPETSNSLEHWEKCLEERSHTHFFVDWAWLTIAVAEQANILYTLWRRHAFGLFRDEVSGGLHWPQICYVVEVDVELLIPGWAPKALGLQVCTTMPALPQLLNARVTDVYHNTWILHGLLRSNSVLPSGFTCCAISPALEYPSNGISADSPEIRKF